MKLGKVLFSLPFFCKLLFHVCFFCYVKLCLAFFAAVEFAAWEGFGTGNHSIWKLPLPWVKVQSTRMGVEEKKATSNLSSKLSFRIPTP